MTKKQEPNEQQLMEMREKYATGTFSKKSLAKEYGISRSKLDAALLGVTKYTPSIEERFQSKVDVSGGEDACWVWMAGKSADGYGELNINGQMVYAHRYAYEQATGIQIPKGMFVCHSCDNPSCVNPSHLSLGTAGDNNNQMFERGRNRNSQLPAIDQLEIKVFADIGIRYNQIAKIKGVSGGTVSRSVEAATRDPYKLQKQAKESDQ